MCRLRTHNMMDAKSEEPHPQVTKVLALVVTDAMTGDLEMKLVMHVGVSV